MGVRSRDTPVRLDGAGGVPCWAGACAHRAGTRLTRCTGAAAPARATKQLSQPAPAAVAAATPGFAAALSEAPPLSWGGVDRHRVLPVSTRAADGMPLAAVGQPGALAAAQVCGIAASNRTNSIQFMTVVTVQRTSHGWRFGQHGLQPVCDHTFMIMHHQTSGRIGPGGGCEPCRAVGRSADTWGWLQGGFTEGPGLRHRGVEAASRPVESTGLLAGKGVVRRAC